MQTFETSLELYQTRIINLHTVSLETPSYLHQSIFPQQRAGEGGGGTQEAGVRHFLDSLSDGQHQCGVDERHDDVGVKLICDCDANEQE